MERSVMLRLLKLRLLSGPLELQNVITSGWQQGENLNDDLVVNNIISIVADPFANENIHTMKFVRWMGVAWKITNVEIQRPRLILTLGGVYTE